MGLVSFAAVIRVVTQRSVTTLRRLTWRATFENASLFPCILDCTSESVEKGLAGAVYKYEKEETKMNVFLASGKMFTRLLRFEQVKASEKSLEGAVYF